MRRFLSVMIVAFATATALVGCGSSSEPAAETTSATGGGSETTDAGGGETTDAGSAEEASATITIENFGYGDPVTVAPGATIRVINKDSARHDVDALDGAFQTDLLNQNEELTFTAPTEPGEYEYTCSVHPQMRGTLIVDAAAG